MMDVLGGGEPFLAEVFADEVERRKLEEGGDGAPDDGDVAGRGVLGVALAVATEDALMPGGGCEVEEMLAGGEAAGGCVDVQGGAEGAVDVLEFGVVPVTCGSPGADEVGGKVMEKCFFCKMLPFEDGGAAILRGGAEVERDAAGADALEKPADPGQACFLIKGKCGLVDSDLRGRCCGRARSDGELSDHARCASLTMPPLRKTEIDPALPCRLTIRM